MMRGRQTGAGMRLIVGVIIAIFAIISYLSSQQFNEVTGENQYLSLTSEQEIALGLQSAPQMEAEFGGLSPDQEAQQVVDQVGSNLVNNTVAQTTPWQFDFEVLDDPNTVNAFALPGGPVYITIALLSRLETEDQLAGVLAHEVTHVLARHSAQQIAKSDLTNGLAGAVGVAVGTADAAQTAAMIGQLVNMRYGREHETQSDLIGVCLMRAAGYDPQGMLEVMQILQEASGGGGSQPEFLSTHPNPENRLREIQEAIDNPEGDCSPGAR
jgi:predicted Zn-dependent protease